MRLLTVRQVTERTSLSRASIRRRVDAGAFPLPVRIPDSTRVGWLEHEIDEWIAQLAAARHERATA